MDQKMKFIVQRKNYCYGSTILISNNSQKHDDNKTSLLLVFIMVANQNKEQIFEKI
jgi:hypothetical protein